MTRPVLVVGASGPLGRAVTGELLAHSHEVLAVSRSGENRFDFTDAAAGRSLLESTRPVTVLHLARPDADRPDTDALRAFASLCAESGVERFVFASSSAVYGTDAPEPRTEDDHLDTRTPYAELKHRSERVLAEVADATGLAAVSLRIFNVYGPGFADSLVNRLVLGQTPPLYVTDSFIRDYIHSGDVARAFRYAAERAPAQYLALNVGTGIGTSNLDLLEEFPDAPYRAVESAAIRSFSVANTSLISRLWGFSPEISLDAVHLYPELVR